MIVGAGPMIIRPSSKQGEERVRKRPDGGT